MGLLDYIKANTPRATRQQVSPSTVISEGLLNPNQFNAPAANRFKDSLFGIASIVPGVGDVASGVEAVDLWNRGEKGYAGLAALGALPLIPAFGGILKTANDIPQKLTSRQVRELIDRNSPGEALNFDLLREAIGKNNYQLTKYDIAKLIPDDLSVDASKAVQNKGPIVINKDGKIIDGRHRAAAAKKQGLKTINAYVPFD